MLKMIRYIDVRIRVPIAKLGQLVDELPDWATLVGLDKLKPVAAAATAATHDVDNDYTPAAGSLPEKILKLTANFGSVRLVDVIKALSKHNRRSVSSAFYQLRNKGLISKQADGGYARS
jgi:hypothetical protein